MKASAFRWLIVSVGFFLLIFPVIVFLRKFKGDGWPSALPNTVEEWAHFGTYVSGTVGVLAVLGTLVSVLITLRQQGDMLKLQKSEYVRNEAYSVSTVIFPTVRERLSAYYLMGVNDFLVRNDLQAVAGLNEHYKVDQIKMLFTDDEASDNFKTFRKVFSEQSGKIDIEIRAERVLNMIKSSSSIVRKCISGAPELYDFLYDEELRKAFECYQAYERGRIRGRTIYLGSNSKAASPIVPSKGIALMWYKLGKKISKPAS